MSDQVGDLTYSEALAATINPAEASVAVSTENGQTCHSPRRPATIHGQAMAGYE